MKLSEYKIIYQDSWFEPRYIAIDAWRTNRVIIFTESLPIDGNWFGVKQCYIMTRDKTILCGHLPIGMLPLNFKTDREAITTAKAIINFKKIYHIKTCHHYKFYKIKY